RRPPAETPAFGTPAQASPPTATAPTVALPHAWRSGREEARRLPDSNKGAQRVSSRKVRSLLTGAFAALLIVTAMTVVAPQAEAASRKVVIVVGPVGSATADYKRGANRLAKQAASYGA